MKEIGEILHIIAEASLISPSYEDIKDSLEAVIENTDFGTDVVIEALLREDKAPEFEKKLADLTAGTVSCEDAGERFCGVRIR